MKRHIMDEKDICNFHSLTIYMDGKKIKKAAPEEMKKFWSMVKFSLSTPDHVIEEAFKECNCEDTLPKDKE